MWRISRGERSPRWVAAACIIDTTRQVESRCRTDMVPRVEPLSMCGPPSESGRRRDCGRYQELGAACISETAPTRGWRYRTDMPTHRAPHGQSTPEANDAIGVAQPATGEPPCTPRTADLAEMIVRVDTGAVAVAPVDTNRIIADGLHAEHFERGLVHLKRTVGLRLSRRSAVRSRARRARALIPQVREAVFAMVPVFPVDLDAFRLRNGNMFRVGC